MDISLCIFRSIPLSPPSVAQCWHSTACTWTLKAHKAVSRSTSRSECIGLHQINLQYGHRKWNNRTVVESRCQNESRTSFLRTTYFSASTQVRVDAADSWQMNGRVQYFGKCSGIFYSFLYCLTKRRCFKPLFWLCLCRTSQEAVMAYLNEPELSFPKKKKSGQSQSIHDFTGEAITSSLWAR